MSAEVEETADLRELMTRAALLRAIQKRVNAEAKAAQELFETEMRKARKASGAKGLDVAVPDPLGPDGERVAASVSFNKDGKPTVTVAHMEGAVEWVARNHPVFIREVIDPTFLTNLLKGLEIVDGQVVYPKTGEVLDWARPVAGARGSMVMRFPDDGDEALLAAWLAGHFNDVQIGALPAPPSPGAGG